MFQRPGPVPPAPLVLPVLPASEAARESWAALRRRPGPLGGGEEGFRARPLPLRIARAAAPAWAGLRLEVAGRPLTAHAPEGAARALALAREPLLGPEALDEEALGRVLEFLLAEAFDLAEAGGWPRGALLAAEVADEGPRPSDAAVELSGPGLAPTPLLLALGPALWPAFRAWGDGLAPDPARRRGARVAVRFAAGVTTLSRDEFLDLRAGDEVVFDSSLLGQQKVVALVGDALARACTITPRHFLADGPLAAGRPSGLAAWTEGDAMAADQAGAARPAAEPMGAVPVRLVFEVGRLDIALAELEAVGEGHVFDLGRPQLSAVDIVAGGRVVGAGDLVRIGEGIGVHVTRLER